MGEMAYKAGLIYLLYEIIQRYKRRHTVPVIRNRVTPEDVARILGVTL